MSDDHSTNQKLKEEYEKLKEEYEKLRDELRIAQKAYYLLKETKDEK